MNSGSKGGTDDTEGAADGVAIGQMSAPVPTRLIMLRLDQVIEQTGLRKTTIYKLQKLGKFPKSIPLTDRSVRWIESEVQDYLVSRAATRNNRGVAE